MRLLDETELFYLPYSLMICERGRNVGPKKRFSELETSLSFGSESQIRTVFLCREHEDVDSILLN